MSAAPSVADDRGVPSESRERLGRGVVVFWSAIILFVGALVVWVPRHRLRLPATRARPADRAGPTVPSTPAARPRGAETRPPESTPPVTGLVMPVVGIGPGSLHDSFAEIHSGHRHEAIDILAPRGTPVVAAADGTIRKLFHSVPGGITIYEFDPGETRCFYYAHLDRYADGLAEGQKVAAGTVIGYVGTSGNAPPQTPHLHFAIYRLGPEKRWWEGTPVNPYPSLSNARPVL